MTENSAIHPTSIVHPGASLGQGVQIGPYTIINDGVTIGKNSTVGSHCEIGIKSDLAKENILSIGENSIIRSHSIFYSGSRFGNSLTTGHRVTVRENTFAGANLQIGTLSDLQGDCSIGNYVRFHSNVHIGKGSVIEDFVWIFPYVVLTNDPHPPSEVRLGVTIKKYAVVATMSTILPGVIIGEGALIGAHSLVNHDVPQNSIAAGVPSKNLGLTQKIMLRGVTDQKAYPWRGHFHRGYPEEIVAAWNEELDASK